MRSLECVVLLALVAGVGCGLEADGEKLVYEGDDGKSDEAISRPFGTWSRELGDDEDGFYALTLTEKRRHHYAQRLVTCDPANCVDERTGRYRYAARGDSRYIVLLDGGRVWYSFEYQLDGDTLRLRYAGMGYTGNQGWFELRRASQAWCQAVEDCAGQGLAPECGTRATFQCAGNLCSAGCGPDEERCSDLEGAIDDGMGMNGYTLDECIEELGGEPIRRELEACCAADQRYYFCWDR